MTLRVLACIALAFALSSCSTTQTQPTQAAVGALSGVVTGPNGPVAGALISVTAPDGSAPTAVSTADGYFEINRVPAGSIQMLVTAAGFAPWQTVATISPNTTLAQDVRLNPQ